MAFVYLVAHVFIVYPEGHPATNIVVKVFFVVRWRMKKQPKEKMITVSLKIDAKRLAVLDQVAEEECGDRSQVLRWAVEAFLLHQKMTGNPLRPTTMKALLQIPPTPSLASKLPIDHIDSDDTGLIAETPHPAKSRMLAPSQAVRYTGSGRSGKTK